MTENPQQPEDRPEAATPPLTAGASGGGSGDASPVAPPSYGSPPAYGAAPPEVPGPYQAAPGYPVAYQAAQPVSPSDERMWALFAHLGGVLVSFIVPLVIYLVYKDRSAYIRDQAAEALNWQITLFVAAVVSVILIIVVIGLFMLLALGIIAVVYGIIAAVAANRGERYRYPFAIRLVS